VGWLRTQNSLRKILINRKKKEKKKKKKKKEKKIQLVFENPFYPAVAEKRGFMPTNYHLTHQLKAKKCKKMKILVK
jgi:hypothetical protein